MNASNVWFKNRQFLKDYYYSINFKEMKDIKVNHWFALSALFHVKALTVDVLFKNAARPCSGTSCPYW